MTTPERTSTNATRGGVAGIGVAALAIVCCASLPLVVGVAGSMGAAALIGAGVGGVALIALAGLVALTVRARWRRACEVASHTGTDPTRTQRAR